MTSLLVALPSVAAAGSPDIYLLTESGEKFRFDVTLPESSRSGQSGVWGSASRPGRKPLSRQAEKGLKSHSFTALIGIDAAMSIEARLATLERIAASGARVQLVYGRGEAGWWTITELAIQVNSRAPASHDASRAEVTFTLTEANAGQQAAPSSNTSRWRTHTVRKGDTLWKLSVKYLGKGSRWKQIASANGIKNPKARSTMKVGRRLRIPPR